MRDSEYASLAARVDRVLNKQIFFVCGMAKSGTTWLELLLDSHPEIVCKGEAHFFDFLRQYLGEGLNRFNRRLTVDGGHTNRIAYQKEDLRFLMITAAGLMFARWDEGERIKCIGEKTPANLNLLPVVHRHFPEAKLLHIIRDGRDAAVSGWFFNLKRNEAYVSENFKDFSGYVVYYAKIWSRQIGQAREFGRHIGERYIEVRYENLLERPEAELQRLLGFLDVDHSEPAVRSCLEAASFETLSAGRERGQEERQSFYRKGMAGDWVNHFSERDVEAFHQVAGTLLEDLGYAT